MNARLAGPDPAGHAWPEADDLMDLERRRGMAYCRRCGYLLAGRGVRPAAARPCRAVSVGVRTLSRT